MNCVLPVLLLQHLEKRGCTKQHTLPSKSREESADPDGPQGRCESGRVGGRRGHAWLIVAEQVEHQYLQMGTHE